MDEFYCYFALLFYLIRISPKVITLKKLPILLISSRIIFGALIIILSTFKPDHCRAIMITLIALGLLSDIFDGILARRLGISTPKLRRMESTVDQIFWLSIIAAAYIIDPVFFKNNLLQILLLVGLEAVCNVLCFVKFRKEVATHAISSKFWTLILSATLMQIIALSHSVIFFNFLPLSRNSNKT